MQNKNVAISIIRMMSMILIISCHILQGLNNRWAFWVNIGVQIFFFISGFLYGNKKIDNIWEFYKKRIAKILIPLSLLIIIMVFAENIFFDVSYTKLYLLGGILGMGGFNGNINTLSHTWFISYILICYLITPILNIIFNSKVFKKNAKKFIYLIFFLQLLQIYKVTAINTPWLVNYILGYFYSRCCTTLTEKRKYEIFIFIITILILPFGIIYQENINMALPETLNQFRTLICDYGHVMLGTSIFIILYKFLCRINVKNNSILYYSDKYSFYIYLVHQIFILNVFSLLNLTDYLIVNIIIIIVVSNIFGIMLYNLYNLFIKLINKLNLDLKKKIKKVPSLLC